MEPKDFERDSGIWETPQTGNYVEVDKGVVIDLTINIMWIKYLKTVLLMLHDAKWTDAYQDHAQQEILRFITLIDEAPRRTTSR